MRQKRKERIDVGSSSEEKHLEFRSERSQSEKNLGFSVLEHVVLARA